jgi:hypothetical protein
MRYVEWGDIANRRLRWGKRCDFDRGHPGTVSAMALKSD